MGRIDGEKWKEEGGWSGGSNGSGKIPRLEETVGGDGGGEDLRDWTTRSRLGCLYSKQVNRREFLDHPIKIGQSEINRLGSPNNKPKIF